MIEVMRVIMLLLFAGAFAVTPVYLLNTYVMPQMLAIKGEYEHLDATASKTMEAAPTR